MAVLESMLRPILLTAVLLAPAPALAGASVRQLGKHTQVVRVTGKFADQGGGMTCRGSSGMGDCDVSVLVGGEQRLREDLDVTHDDGDVIAAQVL